MNREQLLQAAEDALVKAQDTALEIMAYRQQWSGKTGGLGSADVGLEEFQKSMLEIAAGFTRLAEVSVSPTEDGICRCKPMTKAALDRAGMIIHEKS